MWLKEIAGREAGDAPAVDLKAETHNGALIREWIGNGQVTAVHDVSDGGLLVALAEMALASGLGCTLETELTTAQAFGEDQSRYVVTAPAGTALPEAVKIGTVGGTTVAGVEIAALREANDAFFREWMEA